MINQCMLDEATEASDDAFNYVIRATHGIRNLPKAYNINGLLATANGESPEGYYRRLMREAFKKYTEGRSEDDIIKNIKEYEVNAFTSVHAFLAEEYEKRFNSGQQVVINREQIDFPKLTDDLLRQIKGED